MGPVLAATLHDPGGHFLPGIVRAAPRLKERFAAFAVHASTETSPAVIDALNAELGATLARAPADGRVGAHRRAAVGLAAGEGDPIVHIDFDHILRWAGEAGDEVASVISEATAYDMAVVGRSPAAMATWPRRLTQTEVIANHIFELITGHAWDLMSGVRILSRSCASRLAIECREDSIGNDVEWPLWAETAGYRTGYVEAERLTYRTRLQFDAPADSGDENPRQWIRRVEILAEHAAAMRPFAPRET